MHSLMPNKLEWLSALTCINAVEHSILGFYIFRRQQIRDNFIRFCEDGAAMAMQPEAWLTQYLFFSWISYFINSLDSRKEMSPQNRHLLIVEGHNSHVTLEVVMKSMKVGLNLITLPSHTSHCLQPLDVSVFAPFKYGFKCYRDAWVLRNRGRKVGKHVLAIWVFTSLQKALTPVNIKVGFSSIRIWPLNLYKVDRYLSPARPFS